MYGVELYRLVRTAVMQEGLSHRAAARRFGIDRGTVAKIDLEPVSARISTQDTGAAPEAG